jgi:transcriptional regulator with XRE-family HTH domain
MDGDFMEFKDRLKTLRAKTKTSVTNLAVLLNKSESAIRMWESGKYKPDTDTLITLSKHFNCSTDYLLGLSDNENQELSNDYSALIKDILRKKDDPNDPEMQAILTCEDFWDFLVNLINALYKNKRKNAPFLYMLLNKILYEEENTYREWGDELMSIYMVVSGLFELSQIEEDKSLSMAKQVVTYVGDLIHATHNRNRKDKESENINKKALELQLKLEEKLTKRIRVKGH